MDYRKKLIVEPGTKIKLRDIDPAFHGKHATHEAALTDLQKEVARLTQLQYLLYAEKKHALLIVLQGIDAAGKDGTCWHVLTAMNPQGTTVTGFKQPSEEERAHDFLWRINRHTPALGQVGVFNRSHYEDVLVVRVHKLVPREVWSRRYTQINDFETRLVDHGTTIIKFFLYISPEEQLERFRQRLEDPHRQWKISDADYKERAYWDQYIAAYEDMLQKCSTSYAPWYVIPSNHKWFRNLAVSRIIADTLEDLGMKMPKPTVDLETIRQQYHAAATTASI
ncbi:polyphosphate kinase 2 family protein [Defluviicoccus vanus]|uniref:Polyphosphate kinase 2 family protein n=1 Tax=Defluviicoccus vanus TaxID=111831 RepID=A0A7H1MZF9_9PROT|nr:polyphosphate kinase 2 family protein [Defluviicoccus vanus]QNT68845.1 polyphosphate kinase 2 family protein [Defluviicoccus vanus]